MDKLEAHGINKSKKKIDVEREAILDNDSYGAIVLGVIGWVAAFLLGSLAAANSVMLIMTVLFVFCLFGLSIFHGTRGLTSHIVKTKIRSIIGLFISILYIVWFISTFMNTLSMLEEARKKTEEMNNSNSKNSYIIDQKLSII